MVRTWNTTSITHKNPSLGYMTVCTQKVKKETSCRIVGRKWVTDLLILLHNVTTAILYLNSSLKGDYFFIDLQALPRSIANVENDLGSLTLTLGFQEKSMKKRTFFWWRVYIYDISHLTMDFLKTKAYIGHGLFKTWSRSKSNNVKCLTIDQYVSKIIFDERSSHFLRDLFIGDHNCFG